MNAKITLYSDKELIEQIKIYAKEHNTSVSKIVNEFFKNLLDNRKNSSGNAKVTNSLRGILKDSSVSEKDYLEHLEKKYL